MSAGRRVKCKLCNDVIQSMYRHDFKWCSCKKIAVDGGSDYLKTVGALENIEFLEHEVVELLRCWSEWHRTGRVSFPRAEDALAQAIFDTAIDLSPRGYEELYDIAIEFARGADAAGML